MSAFSFLDVAVVIFVVFIAGPVVDGVRAGRRGQR